MASTASSNFSAETALQKSGTSSAYIVNRGSDALPVISPAPSVPSAAPTANVNITVSSGVAYDLSGTVPNGFDHSCVVELTFATAPQFNCSSVGRVTKSADGLTFNADGFGTTQIGAVVGNGTAVTSVQFAQINVNPATGSLYMYAYFTGAALVMTVSLRALASSAV